MAEKHYDKNFGATLAIWDWIFGSLNHSEDTDKLILGVTENEPLETHGLYNLYVIPLIDIFQIMSIKRNALFNYCGNKTKKQ